MFLPSQYTKQVKLVLICSNPDMSRHGPLRMNFVRVEVAVNNALGNVPKRSLKSVATSSTSLSIGTALLEITEATCCTSDSEQQCTSRRCHRPHSVKTSSTNALAAPAISELGSLNTSSHSKRIRNDNGRLLERETHKCMMSLCALRASTVGTSFLPCVPTDIEDQNRASDSTIFFQRVQTRASTNWADEGERNSSLGSKSPSTSEPSQYGGFAQTYSKISTKTSTGA